MSTASANSKSHASLPSALIYAALLTSMLYLLTFHLSAAAPMRSEGYRPPSLEAAENIQGGIVTEMQRVSEGKNLQLHFHLPDNLWPRAFFFVTIYFRASYEFYPQRVFVGTDDHIINSPQGLQAADQLPTNDWFHQHGVSKIFWMLPGDDRGPAMWVNPVP